LTLSTSLAVVAGGFCAGAVNSIAGGGTLISFPMLIAAGYDPLLANATNSVALWPGSVLGARAFRPHLAQSRAPLRALILTPLAGSVVGALLLLRTSSETFSWLVPYLIVSATVLFALPDRWINPERPRHRHRGVAFLSLFAVGVYGGYFGAGMGIMILATLGLLGISDLHERNAIKNIIAALVGMLSALFFVPAGLVLWEPALLVAVGAACGGYVGGRTAQRFGRTFVRRAVVLIGVGLTLWYFAHPA
jgi:uncharacterized membrane protein YfcA